MIDFLTYMVICLYLTTIYSSILISTRHVSRIIDIYLNKSYVIVK